MAMASHTAQYMSGVTEQRPPSLLQLNSVLLPGRGGETVQGEWASPCAARRCERRSRGPSPSCPGREGVLLAGEGGENMAFKNPQRASNEVYRKSGFQLHPTLGNHY